MSSPYTTLPVNLGTRFEVHVTGLEHFPALAGEMRRLKTQFKRVGFGLTGDWDRVIGLLETIPRQMRENLEKAVVAVGVMHLEDVRGAWNTQLYSGQWAPLSAAYLAWKIRSGLDRRTLVATEEALSSLGVNREKPHQQGVAIEVGVTATEGGVPYMVVQELGSRDGSIPPRPLVKPTLEANLDRYSQVFGRAIELALEGQRLNLKVP